MTEALAPFTGKLVARTERLDVDLDLLDVAGEAGLLFERGKRGFASPGPIGPTGPLAPLGATQSTGFVIDVPRSSPAAASEAVHEALGSIEVDDDVGLPGCGPIAMGALPFSPTAPGWLTVPSIVVGRADDGTRWLTTVSPVDAPAPSHDEIRDRLLAMVHDAHAGPAASDFHVASPRTPQDWCAALVEARDQLRRGAAQKVVLAREILITAEQPLSRHAILSRLRKAYPACMLFAVDGFIGASPELLVARAGDIVRAQPMAGTTPRSSDPTTDARLAAALLSSTKDREEHRITIDMVHDTLLPFCSYLDEEAEPSVVAMANVQHLATMVEGRLSSPAASAVELMAALHPTPAVCGSPRPAALALIDQYEAIDRGRYAGPVGWVDAAGNGEWAVGIRSAELDGNRARLFAGVGVVADSDPDAELAETQAKLQALLSAVVRP